MKIAVLILAAMLMSCTRASKPEVSSLKFDFSKINEKGSGLIPQSAIPSGSSVCYAVNVVASDIPGILRHQCSPHLGVFAGFIAEAETLSVEVPFGKDREVQLYAFLPKPGSPCIGINGKEGGPKIDPQSVFLVGKLTNQIFDKAEITLPMPVNFPGTDHSIFADLRMGSSCLNTSPPVIDPNAPVVLKSFLNTTTVSSVGVDENISINILVKSPTLPNQVTLSHDGPNGNISNGPSSQMFYACTLANITTAGHICEGASVDNYYAIKTIVASQWAPTGLYNLSFTVRSSTFLESQPFTGPNYTITNHATFGPPTIESIVVNPDAGLTSGLGGNVQLNILVQSTAGPDLLDKTVMRPNGNPMSMGMLPVTFLNCSSFISIPAHICYLKTINHWFYELNENFHPFLQNGTYIYQNIRVRNLTNLFSPAYAPINVSVSGNLTPITPNVLKVHAFYAFDADPFSAGIPYYNSSCVRPEGGNANLGVRMVAQTNADVNYISYTLQGPNSVLASGGQGIPTVNLGGNLWQADYSNLISGVTTAPRGSYSWNNLSVKNIAYQDSNVVQGPTFNLSDSCLTTYSSIESKASYTCGITTSGKIKCWGQNSGHTIDHGSTAARTYPTVVDGDDNYIQVSAGSVHTCGINSINQLKCWGSNGNGQLGDGTFLASDKPRITDIGTLYVKVSVGATHTCGITNAGVVKCWGRNVYGQLGDGSNTDRLSPIVVDSGVQYSNISAGGSHTCGITVAGVLKCWGQNSYGQLGDGTATSRTTPTIINAGNNYSSVNAGATGSCAITTAGALKCWGQNSNGELGDGTTINKNLPTIIDAGTGYTSVSIAYYHTCGTTSTQTLKCWGSNSFGQIGDGTAITRMSPVVINSGISYSQATTGMYHSCAITTSGLIKCWGQNTGNQLGNGNTSGSSTPLNIDL